MTLVFLSILVAPQGISSKQSRTSYSTTIFSKKKVLLKRRTFVNFVGPLGLEPRMTVPKTGVLPITPWANPIT